MGSNVPAEFSRSAVALAAPAPLASRSMSAPVDVTGHPLRLVSVHAHPDDEASKGAGTVARYADEGIRAALVCCTGGEEGDILNPAADTPEIRADLRAVREAELRASVDAIGYAELYLLGYRDSGMPDTEANARPDNFANAPLDEAVGRLVAIIRREQPQVLITYGDEQRVLQASRPHPGARDLRPRVRGRRRSGPLSRRRRRRGSRRSSTTRASRSAASVRCTTRTSSSGRRARTPSASPSSRSGGPTRPRHRAADHVRRRRRPPRGPPRRAARAPHADRSRQPLDARPRRPHARRPSRGRSTCWPDRSSRPHPCRPPTSRRPICSPGCAPRRVWRRKPRCDVAEFLSDEWIASMVGRGAAPGATGTVQIVVTGVPDGDGKWHLRLDDGVVVEAEAGHARRARPHADRRVRRTVRRWPRASSIRAWRSCGAA